MTLSRSDLNRLKELMELTFTEKLDEKLKYLPNKDEFYEETLKIYKKLEDLEMEKTILASRVSEHSDRLEKLETAKSLI